MSREQTHNERARMFLDLAERAETRSLEQTDPAEALIDTQRAERFLDAALREAGE